jgi:hypothetical protein
MCLIKAEANDRYDQGQILPYRFCQLAEKEAWCTVWRRAAGKVLLGRPKTVPVIDTEKGKIRYSQVEGKSECILQRQTPGPLGSLKTTSKGKPLT